MTSSLVLDHVIYGTRDLAAAARVFEDEYGLASYDGGRHQGLGTGNRIVPLGDAYIELMGVVDADEAGTGALGTWLHAQTDSGDRPIAWCVRCEDIEVVTARLGLSPVAMQRERPDGSMLSWRLAGLERALGDGAVPFFIQWDVPEDELPGRMPLEHPAGAARIAWVEVGGDEAELRSWLSDHHIDVRVTDGAGVLTIGIETSGGEIVIV